MNDRLLIINTNIWKIESNMTVDEAFNEITTAKKEWRLAIIKKAGTEAMLADWTEINTDATEYLNMDEVKVFSFVDNILSPKEGKK